MTETKRLVEKGYKSLVAARPSVWACFHQKDDWGNYYVYKSRVVYWGLTEDGQRVGFVIGTNSGMPESAQGFNNFWRYEYGRGSERTQRI